MPDQRQFRFLRDGERLIFSWQKGVLKLYAGYSLSLSAARLEPRIRISFERLNLSYDARNYCTRFYDERTSGKNTRNSSDNWRDKNLQYFYTHVISFRSKANLLEQVTFLETKINQTTFLIRKHFLLSRENFILILQQQSLSFASLKRLRFN